MRLYLEKEKDHTKNKDKYLNIYFWSFVKCHFFGGLGISIILIIGIIVIPLIFSILGKLF